MSDTERHSQSIVFPITDTHGKGGECIGYMNIPSLVKNISLSNYRKVEQHLVSWVDSGVAEYTMRQDFLTLCISGQVVAWFEATETLDSSDVLEALKAGEFFIDQFNKRQSLDNLLEGL